MKGAYLPAAYPESQTDVRARAGRGGQADVEGKLQSAKCSFAQNIPPTDFRRSFDEGGKMKMSRAYEQCPLPSLPRPGRSLGN